MTEIRVLTGDELARALDDVARLRMAVFRTFPYLYDGNLAYEREYLRAYDSPGAIVVAAVEGGQFVGASTGARMEAHAGDFAVAFDNRPEPLSDIFYCAESVLLPEFRGKGIGHAFFDAREAHARALGRRYCAFCSVIRSSDHPARPHDHRPLDGFWRKRGYAPLPGVIATFRWLDIGDAEDSAKSLQFWMKEL